MPVGGVPVPYTSPTRDWENGIVKWAMLGGSRIVCCGYVNIVWVQGLFDQDVVNSLT